jgi:hypothetical protein
VAHACTPDTPENRMCTGRKKNCRNFHIKANVENGGKDNMDRMEKLNKTIIWWLMKAWSGSLPIDGWGLR